MYFKTNCTDLFSFSKVFLIIKQNYIVCKRSPNTVYIYEGEDDDKRETREES